VKFGFVFHILPVFFFQKNLSLKQKSLNEQPNILGDDHGTRFFGYHLEAMVMELDLLEISLESSAMELGLLEVSY